MNTSTFWTYLQPDATRDGLKRRTNLTWLKSAMLGVNSRVLLWGARDHKLSGAILKRFNIELCAYIRTTRQIGTKISPRIQIDNISSVFYKPLLLFVYNRHILSYNIRPLIVVFCLRIDSCPVLSTPKI